jgi:hypothetical protein
MAVPTPPTVTSLVTQALKRAGRTTPTATQITEATDHALQEVKADIMLMAPTHPNLAATSTAVTTMGQARYNAPDDWNEFRGLVLLDGPEEWRGQAQAATNNTITLASTFSADTNAVIGKYIILTDGPGITQYRQILNYNNSTKVASVDVDWEPDPTVATSYLVISNHSNLWPLSLITEMDRQETPGVLGSPYYAAVYGQEYTLYPTPDRSSYGILTRYYVDLSSLDEAAPLFLQLLAEWRSLWIQGIAVKSMQRFDEDRYQSELKVYEFMLDKLASQTCLIRQMRQAD